MRQCNENQEKPMIMGTELQGTKIMGLLYSLTSISRIQPILYLLTPPFFNPTENFYC